MPVPLLFIYLFIMLIIEYRFWMAVLQLASRQVKRLCSEMNSWPFYLALCILSFLGESLNAQIPIANSPTPVKLEAITKTEGLAAEKVISAVQDHQGFLWIGTQEGLHRYDGYNLVTYQHHDTIPGSLSDNTAEELYVDKNGTLWVGTWNGLNRYDRASDSFRSYLPDPDNSTSISGINIQEIVEDSLGQLWIGTGGGGVSRYLPEQDAFVNYQSAPNDPSSLNNNVAAVLYVDHQGTLWVGTGSPWDHEDNLGGLNRYDPEKDVFVSYTHDPNDPNSLGYNEISALFEDQEGRFWVATWGGGLQLLDRRTGKFSTPTAGDGWPLWTYWHQRNAPTGTIKTIHQDKAGVLWIGYFSGGLDRYDPKTKVITNYTSNPDGTPAILDNIVWKIYEDQEGIIWLCTWKGLNKIIPQARPFQQIGKSIGLRDEHVEEVFIDQKEQLWLGTWAGLEWLDPKTKRFRLFEPKPLGRPSDVSSMVLSIIEDHAGTLWAGSLSYGLTRFDRNKQVFTYFPIKYKDQKENWNYKVTSILEDSRRSIWAASLDVLLKFDPEGRQMIPFFMPRDSAIFQNEIYVIKESGDVGIWVGALGGLYYFDTQNESFTSLLKGLSVTEIFVEDEKTLWLGTAKVGLLKYNIQEKTFVSFAMQGGPLGEDVLSLKKDQQGRLWVATNQGLGWFDEEEGNIRPFSEEKGPHQNAFYPAAMAVGEDGTFLFGSSAGVFKFDPGEIHLDTIAPKPMITGLRIFNEAYPLPQGDTEALHPTELKLTYHQNDLTFEYVGLHFVKPEANTYRYILENYEDNWREVGNQRSAIYPNLPPGRYVFRVQSANPDGQWSQDDASIKIYIRPPWWRTWLAFIIYGLLIVLGGVLLDRYQRNRLLKKERERISMQEAQLRAEVAETQAQQLKELDEAKARLYTNITHEFRTPLTVIQGMTENIKGHQHERDLIRRNSRNLLQLINQLLDLSKLEANAMELYPEQGDMISYLQYLTESFYSLAQEKEIRLLFYPEVLSLMMDFDESHIQQIVYNLLSNALKFTSRMGKVVLHVCKLSKGEMPFLQLKVQDNGIGIPEDQLPRIFDRFYQADGSSTRKSGGTGVGLALTKKLVDLMEGTITVESTEGKGTLFTILLPITNEAPVKENGFHVSTPREVLSVSVSDKPRSSSLLPEKEKPVLLLIEDNADIVIYITDLLEYSYTIVHARDGKEGIEIALNAIPDIVISDVMMPEVDGYEVCQTLKKDERSSHIPIILLTAKSTQEDRVKGLEVGADAYLVKPFHKEELFVRLEKLVALRKTLQSSFAGTLSLNQKITNKKEPTLDDLFLQKLYKVVAEKMDDPDLGVVHLCRAAKLSNTQVNRKLKALTGRTPSQFIRVIRLERAKELLQTTDLNISEIAYDVGFNDPNYFSRTFLEEFGYPPSDERK